MILSDQVARRGISSYPNYVLILRSAEDKGAKGCMSINSIHSLDLISFLLSNLKRMKSIVRTTPFDGHTVPITEEISLRSPGPDDPISSSASRTITFLLIMIKIMMVIDVSMI